MVAAPAAPAPEPPDPRPLIADAVGPVYRRIEEVAADAAGAVARAEQNVARALAQVEANSRTPDTQLLAVMRAISRILAIRLLLFLSLIGGFALAVMAMVQQSWLSLALVVAFVLLTVGPLAWLEVQGRMQKQETP